MYCKNHITKVVKTRAKVSNARELEKLGLGFALRERQKLIESTGNQCRYMYWYGCNYGEATAGVAIEASIAVFVYWCEVRRRWWGRVLCNALLLVLLFKF